ncbi:MAG: hypothetical protein ACK5DL_08950 [Burkholderiales bacterium]|jgi:hypothetical protein|nr:hypothetical protein [Betaproteobacteria bacterium]
MSGQTKPFSSEEARLFQQEAEIEEACKKMRKLLIEQHGAPTELPADIADDVVTGD